MYDFNILVKREEPLMDLSFEEMDIDIAGIETPNVESEFISVTLNTKYFESYQEAIGILSNVRKHLMDHGCTKELVTVMNPQLLDHGIILEVGLKADAMYSIESLMEKVDIEKIKETLMRIVDAIINMIQKFYDQNKNDTNTLKELLRTKLYDTSKYDTRKFAGVIGAVYPYSDFVELTKGLTDLDVLAEVKGDEDLTKAISSKLADLLKTAGYAISSDDISRDDSFVIPKERMEALGWEPSKLRNAADMARVMLDAIRRKHKVATANLKQQVSQFDGDTAAKEALVSKLNNAMKVIAVSERVSLILSRQVILLSGLLKTKEGIDNEGIVPIVDGSTPLKNSDEDEDGDPDEDDEDDEDGDPDEDEDDEDDIDFDCDDKACKKKGTTNCPCDLKSSALVKPKGK